MFIAFDTQNEAAPIWNILSELPEHGLKATGGFAAAGITGDQEVAAEFPTRPGQSSIAKENLTFWSSRDHGHSCDAGHEDHEPMKGVGK